MSVTLVWFNLFYFLCSCGYFYLVTLFLRKKKGKCAAWLTALALIFLIFKPVVLKVDATPIARLEHQTTTLHSVIPERVKVEDRLDFDSLMEKHKVD